MTRAQWRKQVVLAVRWACSVKAGTKTADGMRHWLLCMRETEPTVFMQYVKMTMEGPGKRLVGPGKVQEGPGQVVEEGGRDGALGACAEYLKKWKGVGDGDAGAVVLEVEG